MPVKPKHECNHIGCHTLTTDSYCMDHKRDKSLKHREYKRQRTDQEEQSFYKSKAWRSVRQLKLQLNPLCEECERHKRLTQAVLVDHILPIKQGGERLSLSNLQSLCFACHNLKTANE